MCTHATDSPGISKEKHGTVKLGGGPSLTHGSANHPNVVKKLMQVAEKQGIPLQHESSSRFTGTTRTRSSQSTRRHCQRPVCLPLRYMHSVVEMADMADAASDRVTAAFAESVKVGEEFGSLVAAPHPPPPQPEELHPDEPLVTGAA